MDSDNVVQTIPIDEDERYLILVRGRVPLASIAHMTKYLREWWESGNKFCVCSIANCDVEFVRISPDEADDG